MYQVTDDQLTPVKLYTGTKNIITHDGLRVEDATNYAVDDLKAMYVFPVTDPGKPDQTWQTVFGGQSVLIDGEANKPLEITATLQYQVQDLALEDAKKKLIEQVSSHKQAVQDSGYKWEKSEGVFHIVDSDTNSRLNLVGLNSLALNGMLEDGLPFTMADNSVVQITKAEMMDISTKVGAFVITVHGIKTAKTAEIKNLPNLDACKDYDIKLGFPEIPVIPVE